MSWTDVLEIDRAELELLVRVVQRRHARLGLDLPATVRRGAGASVSRSSIPEHGRVTCASLPYDTIDVPIEALRRYYLETASGHPAAIRMTAEVLGADRLVFGSDYPWSNITSLTTALPDCGFTPAQLNALNYENGERMAATT